MKKYSKNAQFPPPPSTGIQHRSASLGVWGLVAFLLFVFAAQNFIEMRRESCTSDEVVHLPAGLTYILKRDFRLNPEHPPLLKTLCALPLLVLRPKIDFTDPQWRIPSNQDSQFKFGFRFLYSNDADRLLFWGRMPIVLIAILLGVFVFRWARDLYGDLAGLYALGIFTFTPIFIAHSHLVTTDVGVSTFLTLSFYYLWRFSRSRLKRHLLWSSVAMGAALGSKFSAVVLFPLALVLLWVGSTSEEEKSLANDSRPSGGMGKRKGPSVADSKKEYVSGFHLGKRGRAFFSGNRRKLVNSFVFTATVLAVVQLSYLGSFDLTLYLKGMAQINKNHDPNFLYYFHSNLQRGGVWYYFPIAFFLKSTIPFVILFFLRIVSFLAKSHGNSGSQTYLLFPAAIYFLAIVVFADPLGIRYLIPIFPFLMIFSAGLIPDFSKNEVASWALWVLLLWNAGASVKAFPYHLSYFNEFVGGSSHGWEWLADSDVDWGQELKEVKKYMDERGISMVTLVSFSPYDNPAYYRIHCLRPTNEEWLSIVNRQISVAGVYVISVSHLGRMRAYGFDWMKKYPLIGNIGNSMFVFQLP